MALELSDCQFHGPALPEPFVKFELEKELTRLKLLGKTTGAEGKQLKEQWDIYRRKLRALAANGGDIRVFNHVIEPLMSQLGYKKYEHSDKVQTREDREEGGLLLVTDDGQHKLRLWTTSFNEDLYAPAKRGRAYRFSHQRIAQRVLLASGERLGLLTNGVQLLLLISDPARPDSTVTIPLDPGWRASRDIPDSFRMFLALASPGGVQAIPELVDKARLQQARVTKELRVQARQAVEHFLQEVLEHPENREWLGRQTDREVLARQLWREGLITIYRLLFVLKLEASDDSARLFSFASTALWRNTFSPSMALSRYARDLLEHGAETGQLLEQGLRSLFRMFERGLQCTELKVMPLGGALFGPKATPILSQVKWGERAVAWLLDRLLWTPKRRGADTRERVHYGSLNVEDLGRVYEALLELETGISTEPMCRLRRQKLEVVVPVAQGEKYRPQGEPDASASGLESDETDAEDSADDDTDDEAPARGKKTKVEWIEAIPPGRFFLRVGLGRKASGSYYTPHSFVRFLVQETLGPQVAERSPQGNPRPLEILKLRVLDPAMGSGHFLVEVCRFLGRLLYEACRLCDEQALAAERRAEKGSPADRAAALEEARQWRQRIIDLPDPDNELLNYLPSRSPEGEESGLSQQRAEALCRRLVATHCLYGVDKNPLAVELAKLALWLESHAEGMPLTFLDHRLVLGDSLTGPFWDKLIMRPSNPSEPLQNLFSQGLSLKFQTALGEAIRYVRDLEAGVGATVAENERKERTKRELDQALRSFRIAAAAWSGGVMLGPTHCDDHAYTELLQTIANTGDLPDRIESPRLRTMIARGLAVDEVPEERPRLYELLQSGRCVPALSFDLTFPEVFYPTGVPFGRQGFHAVLGNPPWDAVRPKAKEFYASFDFDILAAPTKRERTLVEDRVRQDPAIVELHDRYIAEIDEQHRIHDVLFTNQVAIVNGEKTGGDPDLAKLFLERSPALLRRDGFVGIVVPAAFHANEGATGIRRLYLQQLKLRHVYSFENRRKLFEIDSRFKYATIVGKTGEPTDEFSCAFYLHDDEWLFGERKGREPLRYKLDFVQRTGGEYLSFLELRSKRDLEVAETCFANGEPFGQVCDRLGIRLGRELHMTDDAWRFTPTADVLVNGEDPRDPDVAEQLLARGYLVLHEGKTFWHYNDHWEERPRYLVAVQKIADRPAWCGPVRYFRLAFRDIASATNERTGIFCVCPSGNAFGNKAPCDREPQARCNSSILRIIVVTNSFVFDYLLRQRVQSTLNLFIVNPTPFPETASWTPFAVHSALRLTCNHAGYAPLWREQLGDSWRESGHPPLTWPVLSGDDERWRVRAAIDAIVADAYGLSRDQYAHVLSTFSHSSYQRAPDLCLAAFDELHHLGLEAFTKKHDPYWDIPLNESLPQPVIDLPIPTDSTDDGGQAAEGGESESAEFQLTGRAPNKKRRSRKT